MYEVSKKRKRLQKYGLIYFQASNAIQNNINNILDKQVIFNAMKPLMSKNQVSMLLNDLLFDKLNKSDNNITQCF